MKTMTENELHAIDGGNLVGPLPPPSLPAPRMLPTVTDPLSIVPSYLQG